MVIRDNDLQRLKSDMKERKSAAPLVLVTDKRSRYLKFHSVISGEHQCGAFSFWECYKLYLNLQCLSGSISRHIEIMVEDRIN